MDDVQEVNQRIQKLRDQFEALSEKLDAAQEEYEQKLEEVEQALDRAQEVSAAYEIGEATEEEKQEAFDAYDQARAEAERFKQREVDSKEAAFDKIEERLQEEYAKLAAAKEYQVHAAFANQGWEFLELAQEFAERLEEIKGKARAGGITIGGTNRVRRPVHSSTLSFDVTAGDRSLDEWLNQLEKAVQSAENYVQQKEQQAEQEPEPQPA